MSTSSQLDAGERRAAKFISSFILLFHHFFRRWGQRPRACLPDQHKSASHVVSASGNTSPKPNLAPVGRAGLCFNLQRHQYVIYASPCSAIIIAKHPNGFRETLALTRQHAARAQIPLTVAGVKELIERTHPHVVSAIDSGQFHVPSSEPVVEVMPPKPEAPPKRQSRQTKPPPTPATLFNATPAATTSHARRSRPFTGVIQELGETTRTGADKEPYQTFFIKLSNNYATREFIGEQLAELAEQCRLVPGKQIALTFLGKQPFVVNNNGVEEQRHRNAYSVRIIPN